MLAQIAEQERELVVGGSGYLQGSAYISKGLALFE
jgi:hypothetical protein